MPTDAGNHNSGVLVSKGLASLPSRNFVRSLMHLSPRRSSLGNEPAGRQLE